MATQQPPRAQGQASANVNAANAPQLNQPGGGAGQPNLPVIRPEQVASLPHLNQEQKAKYFEGITNLWNIKNKNPPESNEHRTAHQKLIEVTNNVRASTQRWKLARDAQMKAQGQAQQQAGASGLLRQAPGAPGQAPGAQGQQAAGMIRPTGQVGQTAQAGQAGQAAQPGQLPVVSLPQQLAALRPDIRQHVDAFPFTPPPQILDGSPDYLQWMETAKVRYGQALSKLDQSKTRLKGLEDSYHERVASNKPLSPDELAEFNQRKLTFGQIHAEAKRFLEHFRQQQGAYKAQRSRDTAAATTGAAQAGATATTIPPATSGAATAPTPASATGSKGPGQPASASASAAPGDAAPGTPQTAAAVSTPPQTGAASQASQAAQQQAAAQAANASTPVGPPRPLSHEDAINRAARSHASASANANAQAGSSASGLPHSNSTPTSSTTASAYPASLPPHQNSMHHNPPHHTPSNSGNNHAHHNSGNNHHPSPGNNVPPPSATATHMPREINTTKMPIPKQLNVAPDVPVTVSASRPSYSGGASTSNSILGQPSLPKMPGFVLEGEQGERVLSKKKLDELVRQVTGGSTASAGGEALSAEVEEAILSVADDFVDSVVSSACALAKLRANPHLELRDVQLILERNYNIRVPGYASDEIRTVRKFAPAPGWTQKMGAVQAAKISGGKGDL